MMLDCLLVSYLSCGNSDDDRNGWKIIRPLKVLPVDASFPYKLDNQSIARSHRHEGVAIVKSSLTREEISNAPSVRSRQRQKQTGLIQPPGYKCSRCVVHTLAPLLRRGIRWPWRYLRSCPNIYICKRVTESLGWTHVPSAR